MRVAVLFDDVDSRRNATPDERGVLEAVEAVTVALGVLGHDAVPLPAGPDLFGWSDRLTREGVDLVFNLCEGLNGESEGEVLAAQVVQESGIPMTGCPAGTLALARRKDRVNPVLKAKGLPVPVWSVWDESELRAFSSGWRVFPAIVKPAGEDGSVGILQESVVENGEALVRRILQLADRGPVMVQAYVGTREINAAIVDGIVLPLSEISFAGLPASHHPIVDYNAKWAPGSPEDLGTQPVCPALLPAGLAVRIRQMALRAWWALGGAGYGRVDFRLQPPDSLYILEVNPNPDLAPGAGLARAADLQGWDYPHLVERIMAEAMRRAKAPA